MQTSSITSLLLGSRDPDRLRSWYRDALGAEPEADGFLHFGPVGVLVDARDDVGATVAEPGRVILNHEVTDIAAAAKRVEATGAPCIAAIEYREDGGLSFATYEDPDGNYVQLIELGPEYWAKKRARETGSGQDRGPLADARAAVRLPAQDLERARRFYADKLGLEPAEERPGGLRYECGGTAFVVYQSSGRSPGEFTQMGFYVADIEGTVAELRERGVELMEVDLPGMKTVDGIADIEGNYPSTGAVGERAAWFHDSEGNLLGVGQLVMAE
jgi:catechol 2,3-dioxygenase-like lactoylglutathione lyase family enzyme